MTIIEQFACHMVEAVFAFRVINPVQEICPVNELVELVKKSCQLLVTVVMVCLLDALF